MSNDNRKLYQELGELARYIEHTMRAFNSLQQPITSVSHSLPQAKEHLGDLRRLSEEATHKVMGETEALQESQAVLNGLVRRIHACTEASATTTGVAAHCDEMTRVLADNNRRLIEIFTALSFQDLLAQRLNKLTTVLQEVEHKLLELLLVFGTKQPGVSVAEEGKTAEMLQWLERSKTTALKQDLVDDVLNQLGFD